MAVIVKNVVDEYRYEFTCVQWDLMSDAAKADWVVVEDTCGVITSTGSPFAASEFLFTLDGLIAAKVPLQITPLDGVKTINFLDQIQKTVLAGPISGPDAYPTFRPLELTDLPTGIGTVLSVAATAPAAGFTISGSPITTSGTFTFALANDLAALEALSGTGIVARTGAETYSLRTISAGTGISITDGDGVSGNPTITNSAPDQVVALTAGAGVTITGTYPNFTIAATAGTVYYQTLKEGGSAMTQRAAINFVDSARVFALLNDDAINNETEVTYDIATNSIGNAYIRKGIARSVIGVTGNATADVDDIQGTADQVLRVNTAGTALAFGQVATGGITNSAVTYAKIQNVSAANRLLGRVTAGAGVVEELTATQAQTILGFIDGALTTPRIPYASDANTLTDSASLRWLNGTVEVLVGDGTSRDARFSHNQAASIAGGSTFIHGENNVSGTYAMKLINTRNVSNTGESKLLLQVGGASAADPFLEFIVSGASNNWTAGVDNSDADKFKVTAKSTAPGSVANGSFVITSEAVPKYGFNLDAPVYTLDVNGQARSPQYLNTNAAPTVGAIGAGMGTGPVINLVSGGNNGCYITFTTGTTPTADGDLFTVTLATPFPGNFFPVMTHFSKTACVDIGKFYFSVLDAAKFTLKANGTLAASTQYTLTFAYFGR